MPTIIVVTRLHPTKGSGSVKAFASVDINGVLVIHGCRLVEGIHGLFLSMPQEQSKKDSKWYDQVQIKDEQLKALIQAKVIKAYEDGTVKVADGQREPVDPDAPF